MEQRKQIPYKIREQLMAWILTNRSYDSPTEPPNEIKQEYPHPTDNKLPIIKEESNEGDC